MSSHWLGCFNKAGAHHGTNASNIENRSELVKTRTITGISWCAFNKRLHANRGLSGTHLCSRGTGGSNFNAVFRNIKSNIRGICQLVSQARNTLNEIWEPEYLFYYSGYGSFLKKRVNDKALPRAISSLQRNIINSCSTCTNSSKTARVCLQGTEAYYISMLHFFRYNWKRETWNTCTFAI